MLCLICAAPMNFFFRKEFQLPGLDEAEYWRCSECGFVVSKTHIEMAQAEWETLNHVMHAAYQGSESNPDDPKWHTRLQNQTRMINDLQEIGLINRTGRWLDYGCGDAKLSSALRSRHHLNLLNHER